MNNQERERILENAKDFFREQIVQSHINGACERASKLKEY